jgi:hypothetical protein
MARFFFFLNATLRENGRFPIDSRLNFHYDAIQKEKENESRPDELRYDFCSFKSSRFQRCCLNIRSKALHGASRLIQSWFMNPEERVILFCTQQVGLNEMVARFNSSLTGSLNCETFSEKNLGALLKFPKRK